MEKIEHIQKQTYEHMTKQLEAGLVTPIAILDSYKKTENILNNMLIGACQAIADYTRKAEE